MGLKLLIQRKEYKFLLEMEAATIGTIAQVAIWLVGKHLGWF